MRICPQCGAETPELTCRVDGFGTVDASRHRRVDPRDRIGTLFQNRYRIDAVLGAGGMGSVYRATQVRVGRQVALKVIHADLAHNLAVIARFQREGRAIAALVHPNIVQVYDFGQAEDGELFMAMELIEGRTLCDILRAEAPLDPARVAHLGAQLFDALAEAHERSVIHRDLKPDNIFVTDTGRRHDVVKVVDFGVAKIVNAPEDDAMVTARGAILGSPKYMAPEQARGKGVTGHADVYAIGAILYEALTGHPVFDEPSAADYLVAHSVKLPSPPQVRGRELRGPLVDLIMRCLEKKPWDRPDGAARALEMIEAARLSPLVAPEREDPTTAPGELEPPEATPRGRLHRVVFAGTDATEATPEAPRSSALDHASLAVVPMTHEETTPVSHPAWTPIPTPQAWQDPAGDAPPPPLDTRRLSTAPEPGPLAHAAGEPAHDVAPVETGDGLRGGRIYRDPQREGGLWLVAAVLLLVAGAVLYLTANGLGPADDEHARATGSTPIRSAVEDPSRPLSPMPERGPVAPAQPAVPHADPSPLAGAEPGPQAPAGRAERLPGASPATEVGDEAQASEPRSTSARITTEVSTPRPRAGASRATPRTPPTTARPTPPRPTPAPVGSEARVEPETQDVPTRPSDIDDGIHRVLVDSSPQGAQVMMGALPLGRTPLQVELKDLGQAVRLTLEMDGYVPRQVTLSGAQTKVGVPLEPAMTGPDDR